MKPISFSTIRVNRLRRSARRTTQALDEQRSGPWPEGWFASDFDANVLIAVFDTLRLKAGFALHAYRLREGHGGNGIIWALPADSPQVPPDECFRLEGFLSPPKPPGAVSLMKAIEGDGSPWSYLSASILRREAEEFGAFWHGCKWTPQTILSKLPRPTSDPDVSADEWMETGDTPEDYWTWQDAAPTTWEPTYAESGATRMIVLHIRNPLGRDQIFRATDTYQPGSYDCATKTRVLATGAGGFVY